MPLIEIFKEIRDIGCYFTAKLNKQVNRRTGNRKGQRSADRHQTPIEKGKIVIWKANRSLFKPPKFSTSTCPAAYHLSSLIYSLFLSKTIFIFPFFRFQ